MAGIVPAVYRRDSQNHSAHNSLWQPHPRINAVLRTYYEAHKKQPLISSTAWAAYSSLDQRKAESRRAFPFCRMHAPSGDQQGARVSSPLQIFDLVASFQVGFESPFERNLLPSSRGRSRNGSGRLL